VRPIYAMSPTTIWGRSRSNQMTHIFIGARPKPTNITLYSSVSKLPIIIQIYSSVPTNIKTPMNEYCFPVQSNHILWTRARSWFTVDSRQGMATGLPELHHSTAPVDGSSPRWRKKGRGEPWDSHHELHGAAQGLSWLDGDE
jgi:hypothetical protein